MYDDRGSVAGAAVLPPTVQDPPNPTDARPLRIVVADDAYLVRVALTRILAGVEQFEVVQTCEDRDGVLEAIHGHRPDAVLTDIRMPPTWTDEGIQIAREARGIDPHIGVVVLSEFADPSYALELLEAGTARRAYLLKQRVSDSEQLVSAIRATVAGESVIDPDVVNSLVQARARSVRSPLEQLTARERTVLAEIAQGKSNAAIARSLVLTKHAVEKHVNSIFMKLDLGDPADVSRRVMAALTFLASETPSSEPRHRS